MATWLTPAAASKARSWSKIGAPPRRHSGFGCFSVAAPGRTPRRPARPTARNLYDRRLPGWPAAGRDWFRTRPAVGLDWDTRGGRGFSQKFFPGGVKFTGGFCRLRMVQDGLEDRGRNGHDVSARVERLADILRTPDAAGDDFCSMAAGIDEPPGSGDFVAWIFSRILRAIEKQADIGCAGTDRQDQLLSRHHQRGIRREPRFRQHTNHLE